MQDENYANKKKIYIYVWHKWVKTIEYVYTEWTKKDYIYIYTHIYRCIYVYMYKLFTHRYIVLHVSWRARSRDQDLMMWNVPFLFGFFFFFYSMFYREP